MKPLSAIVFLSAVAAIPTYAQDAASEPKLRDILAQGATQLSKADLQALMPGAQVASVGRGGSTKYWENGADGKFIASTDSRAKSVMGKGSTGTGEWYVGDNGTYCVLIEWKKHTEQWCRFIFKSGDKYFGVNSVQNEASPVHELSFSK